jgi:hypothetical protein
LNIGKRKKTVYVITEPAHCMMLGRLTVGSALLTTPPEDVGRHLGILREYCNMIHPNSPAIAEFFAAAESTLHQVSKSRGTQTCGNF